MQNATSTSEDAEVEAYFSSTETLDEEENPMLYWIGKNYKSLSLLALDILVIPASSAPVERVFSTAGECTSTKRNRLLASNLEVEVLIKQNKRYL